jgi:hypothetical protein
MCQLEGFLDNCEGAPDGLSSPVLSAFVLFFRNAIPFVNVIIKKKCSAPIRLYTSEMYANNSDVDGTRQSNILDNTPANSLIFIG